MDQLPPELFLSVIQNSKDPLLVEDFSLTAYLDELLPDEASLANVDIVELRIRAQIQALRDELAGYKTTLARAGQDTAKMAEIQELMGDLLTHIRHLRSGATESEIVVREITREIRSLDTAKRNIVTSMTGVKRFHMLVNAYGQLSKLAKTKRYKEMANALQAVRELSAFFKNFSAVERISTLFTGIRELSNTIREQVTHEFETSLISETLPRIQRNLLLTDACLVIDALGEEARSSMIDWYCSRELKDYRKIFRPQDEAGQLDNLARRFAWFRRVLKQHDDDRAAVFPQHWHVAGYLAGTFTAITADDLRIVLSRSASSLTVSTLLESLQVTTDFERETMRRFGQGFEARIVGLPTLGAPQSMSSAFEPYLSVFVDAQDRAIAEMVQSYRKPLPSLPGGSDAPRGPSVLPSSTELFYFYRETLERCAKLSVKQPFLDLCASYKKWLRIYADEVLSKALVPGQTKRTSSSEARVNPQDLANACLVLNTADYCSETTVQLEERLKERIHPDFKDKVSFETEKDLFIGIIANALAAMLRELDFAIEPAFTAMSRSPWSTLEFVSTESAYIGDLITSVNGIVSSIKGHVEQRKYIRSFADRVVALLLSKMTATLVRARPISTIGAEQILLDLQMLKRCLNRLPVTPGEDAVPTTYTRSVTRQIGKLDTILKCIMTPEDPAEDFVKNYLIIIPCQSFSDFQKMLDLKGVRRTDQNALLDIFLARTSMMTDLSDTSVLTSLAMNPSSLYGMPMSTGVPTAPGSTTPVGVLGGIASPFASLPISREASRTGTPIDAAQGQPGQQQFDLRRFGQGIRAGVRMFSQRDGYQ